MQRLHQNDLSGHLLEKGGFDLIALPAIAIEGAARVRYSAGRREGYRYRLFRQPLSGCER
jgi:hypothetical protein